MRAFHENVSWIFQNEKATVDRSYIFLEKYQNWRSASGLGYARKANGFDQTARLGAADSNGSTVGHQVDESRGVQRFRSGTSGI